MDVYQSPATRAAIAGSLPAASRDNRRPEVADSPRDWTVADLQRWNDRESARADRNDDTADATARALRGVLR